MLIGLDKIKNSSIKRLSTGYPLLDKAFGSTALGKDGTYIFYGMPQGRLVFASGEHGVGKTRLAISVVKKINRTGGKILIFQGEVRPEEFKQWTGEDVANEANVLVSDDRDIEKMVGYIRQEKPLFVVIDSANMIEDYNRSSIIRVILDNLKAAVAEVGCVCFMTGHLTKDGKMKGTTDVPHLVDVECHIIKPKNPKIKIDAIREMPIIEQFRARYWTEDRFFKISVGKNRYGPSGGWAVFCHMDDGVSFIDSSFGPSDDTIELINELQGKDRNDTEYKGGFWSWLTGS